MPNFVEALRLGDCCIRVWMNATREMVVLKIRDGRVMAIYTDNWFLEIGTVVQINDNFEQIVFFRFGDNEIVCLLKNLCGLHTIYLGAQSILSILNLVPYAELLEEIDSARGSTDSVIAITEPHEDIDVPN